MIRVKMISWIDPLLRLKNLSKNFDRLPVLKDVSFSFGKGRSAGIGWATRRRKINVIPFDCGQRFRLLQAPFNSDGVISALFQSDPGAKLGYRNRLPIVGTDQSLLISKVICSPIRKWELKQRGRHPGLVEHFDVATYNILLGREPQKFPRLGIIDWGQMVRYQPKYC